jgi:glycerate 2-kinase
MTTTEMPGDTGRLFEKAGKILWAALDEVAPRSLIEKAVLRNGSRLIIQGRILDLSWPKNVYLVAFGKAALPMSQSLMEIAGDFIRKGIVVCIPGQEVNLPGLLVQPAPHPLPDQRSCKAGDLILELVRNAGDKDLLFVLLSGGGSAQACCPFPGVTWEDKRRVTEELLKRGADIIELNTVRKHLSAIKGGRLAQAASPAGIVNLAISDVIGDDLENIASGPAHWDSSTYADAQHVLEIYDYWEQVPVSVRKVIAGGVEGKFPETLKRKNDIFKKVNSFVIGDNSMALSAAQKQAEELGFKTIVLTSADRGEAREAAKRYVALLASLSQSKNRPKEPLCLISGGELTVRVRGKGKGGRNQEFVLATLLEMQKQFLTGSWERPKNWLVASLGTDGIDGGTDAAGAWATNDVLNKATALGLDLQTYLDANDSHDFFRKTLGLIMTGPTGTNVMDIRIFLLY